MDSKSIEKHFEEIKELTDRILPVLKLDYEYAKNSKLDKDTKKEINREIKGLTILSKRFRDFSTLKSWIKNENYIEAYIKIRKLEDSYKLTPEAILKLHRENRRRILEGLTKYIEKEWSSRSVSLSESMAKKKAVDILTGEGERPDIPPKIKNTANLSREKIIKDAIEKDYIILLDSFDKRYFELNLVKIEEHELEEIKEITKALETAIKTTAENFKKRPEIYLRQDILNQAEEVVKRKLEEGPVETGGYFNYEKNGGKKIVINDFQNVESEDKQRSTSINDEVREEITENSVKDRIIGFHNHTGRTDSKSGQDAVDNMSHGLGKGDVYFMEDMHRGIELIALPWRKSSTAEDIVWFAGMIKRDNKSEPKSVGKLPIHIVDEKGNLKDDKYDWVSKYNEMIKYSVNSRYGPYWLNHQIEEGKIELDFI